MPRQRALQDLGFEWEAERAEWLRWFRELQASSDDAMLGTGRGADFYLYNWCTALLPDMASLRHHGYPCCRMGYTSSPLVHLA